MRNLFFRGNPDADLHPLREELQALGVRLDRVAGVLEALGVRTDAALGSLPEAVVLRALAEVRSASAAAAAAALATVRRHVIEQALKWAWRLALGFAGTQALLYAHAIAEGLHK